jgi:1,4-alpha-glucan branching enzyme
MLKKKYLKTKPVCEVTFQLPDGILEDAAVTKVCLVGDFNDWDETANPMRKIKGVWKTTLKLEQEQEYQYRFLVNDAEWHNDWEADKYIPNNVDGDNSVVVTYQN